MLAGILIFALCFSLIVILIGNSRWRDKFRLEWMGGVYAAAAGALFIFFLIYLPPIWTNGPYIETYPYIPSLNLNLALYLDGLSGLFALMVSGVGALVFIYSAGYFHRLEDAWRFLALIQVFLVSMLVLVLAGDLFTLFIGWELTTLTSFFLIAYKTKDESARQSAMKALLITGGGGIALLIGFILIGSVGGSTQFVDLFQNGNFLRESPFYLPVLFLLSFGAFTKSAQFPFHFWLPEAMSAPAPASAFLHSATMVKAGIYLFARFNPLLGNTDVWFWWISMAGLATMLVGAFLGFFQYDLKRLLAYSTVSQLGVLMMLLGQDTEIAFKSLVVSITAHTLYKGALFFSAGIIEHQTGSRDLRKLSGLGKVLPTTAWITIIAAMSMAGLPPLFGFLAKETLLASVSHPSIPQIVSFFFTLVTVVSGSLIFGQAGIIVWDIFLGKSNPEVSGREASVWMLVPVGVLTVFSVLFSIVPEPRYIAELLAKAAASAYGFPVKVSLKIWGGVSVPLMLSIIAVSLGSILLILRDNIRRRDFITQRLLGGNQIYDWIIRGIDRIARLSVRLQSGKLRFYLASIVIAIGTLVVVFAGAPLRAIQKPILKWAMAEADLLKFFALLLCIGGVVVIILLRRDLYAVLALSVLGFSMAIILLYEPAPDVALVQLIVDVLSTLILILTLVLIPRDQREQAQDYLFSQSRSGLVRDVLVSLSAGLLMGVISFSMLHERPRFSAVSPYYIENAKPLTSASDIVGSIVVDFRGFDTVLEITVFAIASMGILTLLGYAIRGEEAINEDRLISLGKYKKEKDYPFTNSPLIKLLAYGALCLVILLALVHIFFGHEQPGDGFTAGVLVGLGIGFWYLVFGREFTKKKFPWVSWRWILWGLFIAVSNGVLPLFLGRALFSPVDYGKLVGFPELGKVHINTALILELAIAFTVMGSIVAMLDALGRPRIQEQTEGVNVYDDANNKE